MEQNNFITGRYSVEFDNEYDFHDALRIVCTEESVGIESIAFKDKIRIYSGITNLSEKIYDNFSAKYNVIKQLDKHSGIIDISFPIENIDQEFGSLNILFSTMMGDLFGLEMVKNIFLHQIFWPNQFLSSFPGPRYGIKGINKLLKKNAPLFGVIIKPNLGLSPKETGDLAYKLALSGVDFIKDDELSSSPKNCPVFDRLEYVMDSLKKAQKITNQNCLYALNITSDGSNTHRIAKEAVSRGANCLMLNVFAVGFDVLKEIVQDEDIKVPIHTHRCMHDIFTSRNDFGISLNVFAEIARMCGADFFHLGTTIGKQHEKLESIKEAHKALTGNHLPYKSTYPISSRSSILSIGPTIDHLKSKDLLFLSCGAIYKNRLPLEKSVRAMIEGIEYQANGIDTRSENFFYTEQFLEFLYSEIKQKS